MNTIAKRIATAVAVTVMGAAIAQPQLDGKSRAEVRAELAKARSSGELAAINSEDSTALWTFQYPHASSLTRAEVLAEVARARSSGELQALNSEDSAAWLAFSAGPASHRPRREVVSEVARALADGEIQALVGECGCGAFTRKLEAANPVLAKAAPTRSPHAAARSFVSFYAGPNMEPADGADLREPAAVA